MALILFIVILWFMFKVSVFTLKVFGKLVGGILSLLFNLVVGLLGIILFGTAALFLPVAFIMGCICLIAGAGSRAPL